MTPGRRKSPAVAGRKTQQAQAIGAAPAALVAEAVLGVAAAPVEVAEEIEHASNVNRKDI